MAEKIEGFNIEDAADVAVFSRLFGVDVDVDAIPWDTRNRDLGQLLDIGSALVAEDLYIDVISQAGLFKPEHFNGEGEAKWRSVSQEIEKLSGEIGIDEGGVGTFDEGDVRTFLAEVYRHDARAAARLFLLVRAVLMEPYERSNNRQKNSEVEESALRIKFKSAVSSRSFKTLDDLQKFLEQFCKDNELTLGPIGYPKGRHIETVDTDNNERAISETGVQYTVDVAGHIIGFNLYLRPNALCTSELKRVLRTFQYRGQVSRDMKKVGFWVSWPVQDIANEGRILFGEVEKWERSKVSKVTTPCEKE